MTKQAQREAVEKRANEILASKPESRYNLMLKVKAAGIKNFGILNKEELIKVLEMLKGGATKEQIKEQVVKGATERWHAGFGKRKNRQPVL